MTDENVPPVLYGIWIPGRGWLKVRRDETGTLTPFADIHPEVTREVARHIGQGAQIRYIDAAIASLEAELLKQESDQRNRIKKLWDTSINSLRSKPR